MSTPHLPTSEEKQLLQQQQQQQQLTSPSTASLTSASTGDTFAGSRFSASVTGLSSQSSDVSLHPFSASLSGSSPSASSSSAAASVLRKLSARFSGAQVAIIVDSKKEYYAPGDSLSGVVAVTVSDKATEHIKFDEVMVAFEGTQRTWTERGGNRVYVDLQFLKMICPVSDFEYPADSVLVPGRTYTFNFSFVVPEYLLESHCPRMPMHRELPSTIDGVHDCAPEMARVKYEIVARVCRFISPSEGVVNCSPKRTVLFQNTEQIRVVAAYYRPQLVAPRRAAGEAVVDPDNPKQFVSVTEDGYTKFYRRTKQLRRGGAAALLRLASRSKPASVAPGRQISVEASILRPFIYRSKVSSMADTVPLLLGLSFSSDRDEPAPKVECVSVKLRVRTYFATQKMMFVPRPDGTHDPSLGVYTDSFTLANQALVGLHARWSPEPSRTEGFFYSMHASVQLQLPQRKVLVPSFYGCLVGRQYDAEVSVVVSGVGGSGSTVKVRMPVEITTEKVADQILNGIMAHEDVVSGAREEEGDDDVLAAVAHWSLDGVGAGAGALSPSSPPTG
ncbi:uncharacterized protein V1518DRAFT_414419 [Limtongia smithiae]|uniref:uncharacterized protein n=1 Tax=Limtongia smithiae TaxID=1125753 RepID=UPI0034CD4E88